MQKERKEKGLINIKGSFRGLVVMVVGHLVELSVQSNMLKMQVKKLLVGFSV